MGCLFCDIVEGKITAHKIFESENILAFNDINPQAPTHVLLIPKIHIDNINQFQSHHAPILAELMLSMQSVAQQLGLAEDGYRVVMNTNKHGGQTVYHLHAHMLGGRALTWPPG